MTAEARTAIEMPGVMPGPWLETLGKTDPEFVPNLMRLLSARAEVEESSTAKTLQGSLLERGALQWLTAGARAQRGHELFYSLVTTRSTPPSTRINWSPKLEATRTQELWWSFVTPNTIPSTITFVPIAHQESIEHLIDLPLTLSGTAPKRHPMAEVRFQAAFQRAEVEVFEDGMESNFTQELQSLVEVYGPESADILMTLLDSKDLAPEVLAEALRWIGRAESGLSVETRLLLLAKALSSPYASVRDGAILGLASLDDSRAVSYLEHALDAEPHDELRQSIKQVLSQLKTH